MSWNVVNYGNLQNLQVMTFYLLIICCNFYFQKIERLKSSLHLVDNDTAPQNKHIVFVDTDKEGNTQDSFNTGLF